MTNIELRPFRNTLPLFSICVWPFRVSLARSFALSRSISVAATFGVANYNEPGVNCGWAMQHTVTYWPCVQFEQMFDRGSMPSFSCDFHCAYSTKSISEGKEMKRRTKRKYWAMCCGWIAIPLAQMDALVAQNTANRIEMLKWLWLFSNENGQQSMCVCVCVWWKRCEFHFVPWIDSCVDALWGVLIFRKKRAYTYVAKEIQFWLLLLFLFQPHLGCVIGWSEACVFVGRLCCCANRFLKYGTHTHSKHRQASAHNRMICHRALYPAHDLFAIFKLKRVARTPKSNTFPCLTTYMTDACNYETPREKKPPTYLSIGYTGKEEGREKGKMIEYELKHQWKTWFNRSYWF